MRNHSIIKAVYVERRSCWHILNLITEMAKKEEKLSPQFARLICEIQKVMDVLYLEASDAYHEILLMNRKEDEYE